MYEMYVVSDDVIGSGKETDCSYVEWQLKCWLYEDTLWENPHTSTCRICFWFALNICTILDRYSSGAYCLK